MCEEAAGGPRLCVGDLSGAMESEPHESAAAEEADPEVLERTRVLLLSGAQSRGDPNETRAQALGASVSSMGLMDLSSSMIASPEVQMIDGGDVSMEGAAASASAPGAHKGLAGQHSHAGKVAGLIGAPGHAAASPMLAPLYAGPAGAASRPAL